MKKQLILITALVLGLQMPTALAATAQDPIVSEPQFASDMISLGEKTTVTVEAKSPDGLTLTYIWNAVAGMIKGEGASASYTAPNQYPVAGIDTITVSVRDANGRVTTRANTIHLSKQTSTGSLKFESKNVNAKLNEKMSLKVLLDTGGETIDQVNLVIKYDPKMLIINEIKPLETFQEIKDETQETQETNAQPKADTPPNEIWLKMNGEPFSGETAIAEIFFTPKAIGETTLEFKDENNDEENSALLSSTNHDLDVLKEVETALIKITDTVQETLEPEIIEPEIKQEEVEYTYEEEIPAPQNTPDSGPELYLIITLAGGLAYYLRRGR
ncbi:MAG: hypothetical protein NTZ80_00070 [Patescibacteria group bacterium]|nr:hypothetical protein [Patescibacteria group bacterium]